MKYWHWKIDQKWRILRPYTSRSRRTWWNLWVLSTFYLGQAFIRAYTHLDRPRSYLVTFLVPELYSCVSSEESTWTIDSSTALQEKSALIETKHNDTSNWFRTSHFVLLKPHWFPIDCKERQTERFLWDRPFNNLRSRYLWRTNSQRHRLFIRNPRLTRSPGINFPKSWICVRYGSPLIFVSPKTRLPLVADQPIRFENP